MPLPENLFPCYYTLQLFSCFTTGNNQATLASLSLLVIPVYLHDRFFCCPLGKFMSSLLGVNKVLEFPFLFLKDSLFHSDMSIYYLAFTLISVFTAFFECTVDRLIHFAHFCFQNTTV